MKEFILMIGIIIALIMILTQISTWKYEYFTGSIPSASQSSYIPRDVPGATTANPYVSKPTDTEIIDAQQQLEVFEALYARIPYTMDKTQQQTYANLRDGMGDFRNKLYALQAGSDVVDVGDFYATWNAYKSANLALRQLTVTEGFLTSSQQAASDFTMNVINLRETIDRFEKLYKTKNIPPKNANYSKIQDLYTNAANRKSRLNTIDLKDMNSDFSKSIPSLIGEYNAGISILQKYVSDYVLPLDLNKNVITTPSSYATGKITESDLRTLKSNIESEQLRLQNTGITDSTTLTRIRRLGQLSSSINEYITKINNGLMTIDQVPIKSDNYFTFLQTFKNSNELPNLIDVEGTAGTLTGSSTGSGSQTGAGAGSGSPTGSQTGAGAGTGSVTTASNPFSFLNDIQNAKWRINMNLTNIDDNQYKELSSRLDVLEAKTSASLYSGKSTGYSGESTVNDTVSNPWAGTPFDTSLNAPWDTQTNTSYTRLTGSDSAYIPATNSRPGFEMTDALIQHRGSASYFDDSLVGGADYRERSVNLCRQIKEAKLGEPNNFGCIDDPNTVSSGYSWKGNYSMICSRLGDTWSGAYKTTLGCPTTST